MTTDKTSPGAAPAAPEPITPPDPVARINVADNPDLQGEIEFRIPTLYEQLAIERRMSELANVGAHPNSRFRPVESLTLNGQFFVEAIATLEHVIVRAPKGFYESNRQGRPELAVGRLSTIDQDVIVAAYEAYRVYRRRFRDSRRGVTEGDGDSTDGATTDPSGTEGGQ